MTIENSPVEIRELKDHLRLYSDEMDNSLSILLLAAVESVQNYTLIDFESDYDGPKEAPFPIKAAILLEASRLFQNPTDGVDTLQTISKNLLKSYRRWDRIKGLASENS